MPAESPVRLCFVCLGNICRSPTAAAVMRHEADAAGVGDRLHIESAGTSGWHDGDPPDARAAAEARRRGVRMENTASRFSPADLGRFDLVLAMDRRNLADLQAMARTPAERDKIRLLRHYAPGPGDDMDVPDPYFGGERGFQDVFDMIQAACRGLLTELQVDRPAPR